MLGDLDLMQCGKDAPTMRRLSVELSHGHSNGPKDIPSNGLRRVSTSSVSSARSSMSQDSVLSPTFSSSMPNSFYLDRVTSLLGRASSLPMDRAGQSLPSIPSPIQSAAASVAAAASLGASSPTARPLQMTNSAPAETMGRASALIRSLSKGMDSFR
jgi:hypothetical protein